MEFVHMNGNGNGQYQTMEGYGMSMSDGHAPEMGQDYDQSRYGASGGGSMQAYDDSRGGQSGSASFGGPGYRSPLRYSKVMREMNSRNGLYSPADTRNGRGNGDYFSSLPGIGGNEGQSYGRPRNGGNPYY